MTVYRTLNVDRGGPVGWLMFDRPQVGNAMDATMLRELEEAWQELDADDDVRVIVNTGEGKAFQTGLDVVQLSRDKEALREQSRRTKRAELRLTGWHNGVWKPIIAAVNGVCAGGVDAERGHDPHRAVGCPDGDTVAGLDTAGDQRPGDIGGLGVELGEGQADVAVDDGLVSGEPGGSVIEGGGDRGRNHDV